MDTMSVLQYDDHHQLYSHDVKLFSYPDTSDHSDLKLYSYPDSSDHSDVKPFSYSHAADHPPHSTASNTALSNSPSSDHSDVKLFSYSHAPDHLPQSTASNTVLTNSPTYTPLEPLYPSAPPATSNAQYMGAPNTPTPYTVYSYTNAPIYTEIPQMHPVIYTHLKDEGIGSLSPGSHRSSNSSPISTGK